MKKNIVLIVIIVVTSTVLFTSCKGTKKDTASQQSESAVAIAATPVTTDIAKKKILEQSIELIGTLNAWKEINIVSAAQGIIEYLDFEIGHSTSKGEVLVRIDSKLKQLAVENARKNLDKLKNDLERTENLNKGGTASKQELDNAKYSYATAEIALKEAEKQFSDAIVTSPITGIIVKKSVEQGAYITIGSSIATIVDVSKFRVKLNVSETNVYRLRIGDKAIITTDVYPGTTFEGTISFVSSQGDGSHNYPVEVTMNNSKEFPLKAGTFVTATVKSTDMQSRLYITRKSLMGSANDASVYIVENGKALLKSITTGVENGDYIEVVSGLSEGDSVVVVGQINLSDGKMVTVVTQ